MTDPIFNRLEYQLDWEESDEDIEREYDIEEAEQEME